MLTFLFRFILLCLGIVAVRGVAHGDIRGVVFLLVIIALWNWRWILDFVAKRRWRY